MVQAKFERISVQCDICNKPVAKSYLQKHKSTVHGESKNFKCEICGKNYISQTCYEKHLELHNNHAASMVDSKLVPQVFTCDICAFSAPKKENLKRHIERHHMEKTIPCQECTTMFATQQLLRTHVSRVHAKEEIEILPSVTIHKFDFFVPFSYVILLIDGLNISMKGQ